MQNCTLEYLYFAAVCLNEAGRIIYFASKLIYNKTLLVALVFTPALRSIKNAELQ